MPDIHFLIVNTRMQVNPFAAKPKRSARKGILSVIALTVILSFIVLPATASAPSDITITYNPDLHRLFVTITHPSDDPKTHYIRGVQVKINGQVISDPPYKSQPGRNSFTYTYDVMANPDDTVRVVATCIQGQSLEAHIDIPRPGITAAPVRTAPMEITTVPPASATTPPATPGTTYANAGLFPLFGAAAAVLVLKK
jgi:hypothetical protein